MLWTRSRFVRDLQTAGVVLDCFCDETYFVVLLLNQAALFFFFKESLENVFPSMYRQGSSYYCYFEPTRVSMRDSKAGSTEQAGACNLNSDT